MKLLCQKFGYFALSQKSYEGLNPLLLPVPISNEERKLTAFIKPFEPPQRNVKIEIKVDFYLI